MCRFRGLVTLLNACLQAAAVAVFAWIHFRALSQPYSPWPHSADSPSPTPSPSPLLSSSLNRIVVNGHYVAQNYTPVTLPPSVTTLVIPGAVVAATPTAFGPVVITCDQVPGLGTSGRCCQIAELWFVPSSKTA